MKEFFRKRLVAIKRRPQIIPLIAMVVAMCVYTFNLSPHSTGNMHVGQGASNVAGDVTHPGSDIVGMFMFIVTLSSMLCIVSFLTYKKKLDTRAIIGVAISVALIVLQIGLQLYYISALDSLLAINPNIIPATVDIIRQSRELTMLHLVFLFVVIGLIATLPLYRWALRKINTTPKSQLDVVQREQVVRG